MNGGGKMFDEYMNVCGIYKLTFPNGKIYIGLSSNIKKRLITHKKSTDDLPVHKAIRKYGLEESNVSILE
jgi:predicted GIY-YIG superfamily endonuclease